MRFNKVSVQVVLYICLAFTCLGCSQHPPNGAGVTPTAPPKQEPPARVIPGLSVLEEEKSSGFTATPVAGNQKLDLQSVYFFNGSHGWAGGDGVLHKTTDGGKSWTRVSLEIPPRAGVSHISFINSSVGWVVLQRIADSVSDYRENRFWLLRTTDGGATWVTLLEAGDSFAGALAFTDEKSGWLAGTKYVGIAPFRYTYLLLRTDDQGVNWHDVSEPLKRLTSEQRMTALDYINDGIRGLVSDGPAQATVVTGESKVLETVDGGENWRELVSKLNDEMIIRRFDRREHNGLFVAGGRGGHEGTRGGVFIQQPDGSWVSRVLNGVFIKDVLFLPDNGLMACGYEEAVERGNRNRLAKMGIILHSSDGGEHWSIVYRNAQLGAFNSLASNGSGCVWAVGESGLFMGVCPSGN